MTATEPNRIEAVLAYWFGDGRRTAAQRTEFWFLPNPDTDRVIAARFGDDVERAARGDCNGWQDSPRGRLALLVLLDQFPRNIYRGTARAFAQDLTALEVCLAGLRLRHDQLLPPLERGVFYLPLEHAEDLAMQERCVACCEALLAVAPDETIAARQSLEYARAHRDVIRRFGRFPHRNEILGRTSTHEETAFLGQPGSSFGG